MQPRDFETPSGPITVRNITPEDVLGVIALHGRCFPELVAENITWRAEQLLSQQEQFAEGQLVAVLDGKLVGVALSLIIDLGYRPLRHHTYYGITDDGFFFNHDPRGDTLYGADVFVDPEIRKHGIGHCLYVVRREMCQRLNLRRILAGGRLWNYSLHSDRLTPQEYADGVQAGTIDDPVLGFQLREGFVVRGIMKNYISDPRSHDHASLIEWLNPDYRVHGEAGHRGVTPG